jgi:4'-phosphopantetheinyl transferase
VLRLDGRPGGFVLAGASGATGAPVAVPEAAADGESDRHGLLQLNGPLHLGEEPLLLLLTNADQLPATLLERLQPLLSAEERQGLQQRRQAAARSCHGGGLALVRLLLGALLQQSPQTLPIGRGPWGKPELAPGPWPPLQFNLSHSGPLLLLAVHRQRPLGVDLERHRPGLRWRAIARRYFCAATVARLEATPEPLQLAAFTAAWCSFEARLKADGRGLAAGASALAKTGASDRWAGGDGQLYRPRLPEGYSGAVVLAPAPDCGALNAGLA